jgi:hypothetical protein
MKLRIMGKQIRATLTKNVTLNKAQLYLAFGYPPILPPLLNFSLSTRGRSCPLPAGGLEG